MQSKSNAHPNSTIFAQSWIPQIMELQLNNFLIIQKQNPKE